MLTSFVINYAYNQCTWIKRHYETKKTENSHEVNIIGLL